ncbi:hypothetical protein [Marinifilum sp. D737]|uniref:hypothetical protein n=1 Tax=Marinifilum sp. D737 TaxID=2969628 RepID=UPI0022757E3B|nr:hypothetical protein [Marinifilum sp. D737]MCY1634637.1 hypothetical protein [Marinifilum sp. D737]
MRRIDRHNYEEFFLDYLEGNLNDSEKKNLESFLALNPDLKEELDEMCLLELEEEDIIFDKSSLKQIPFETDFEDFCVAKLEGDLEQEEELAFTKYLNENLIGKAQYQLFERTKLKTDNDIIYPDKEELKRKERKIIPYWMISGVGIAASILLLFSVWNTSISDKNADQDSAKKVAYNDSVKKVVVTPTKNSNRLEKLVEIKAESQTTKQEADDIGNQEVETVIAKSQPIENKTDRIFTKQSIAESPMDTKQVASQKVSLPEVIKTAELKVLANVEVVDQKIEVSNQEKEMNELPVNSGLANLGMSWKSSVKAKRKSNSLLYAVAKIGVDKIGEIAGKKVQLDKQYDSETEKTRLNFNTKGLGFSTSIK